MSSQTAHLKIIVWLIFLPPCTTFAAKFYQYLKNKVKLFVKNDYFLNVKECFSIKILSMDKYKNDLWNNFRQCSYEIHQ